MTEAEKLIQRLKTEHPTNLICIWTNEHELVWDTTPMTHEKFTFMLQKANITEFIEEDRPK